MLKTARLYLHSSGQNTGTCRTDGRTNRHGYYSGLHCEQCGRAVKSRLKVRLALFFGLIAADIFAADFPAGCASNLQIALLHRPCDIWTRRHDVCCEAGRCLSQVVGLKY